MRAESPRPLDADEPIAWLRAYAEGVEPRVLPLFRRPARVTVGSGRACDWRFEAAELAELELVLSWDGVRLRAEDVTRPPARATVRPGQSVVAGATGRLRIALDLVVHDDEVTMIRKLPPAPAADETTAPIPVAPIPLAPGAPVREEQADEDQRTVITVAAPPALAPPPAAPPALAPAPGDITAAHPWRVYLPPRNGAADGEPTREWPADDALRPTADLLDRLGKRGLRTLLRRAPPRRIALWGALAVVVAIEAFVLLRPRRTPAPPLVQSAPAAARGGGGGHDRRARVMLPDKEVEVELHRAIAAYRAGKTADALGAFAHLAEDTNDPAARTMLFVLRNRGAGAP